MTEQGDALLPLRVESLEEVDRGIARLAAICQVRILEAGVIGRVLKGDGSVCGTANAAAFAKLRALLMMHLAMRQKLVDAFGQTQTAAIEDYVIERLRQSFPELAGPWPPA